MVKRFCGLFLLGMYLIKLKVETMMVNSGYFWDVVLGIGIVLFIWSIPWRQLWYFLLKNPEQYLAFTAQMPDLLPCLSDAPQIVLDILLENNSEFDVEIDGVEGDGIYEVVNRHSLQHLMNIQPKTIKARRKEMLRFHIPVGKETATSLINYWKASSHIIWTFELHGQLRVKLFKRSLSFKRKVTTEMFPPLLKLDKVNEV